MHSAILNPDAKEDFQALLEAAIDAAAFFLDKNREFYPFAMVLDKSGEVQMHAEELSDNKPASQEVIDVLTVSIGRKTDIKAAAIATMAYHENKDVISIDFDHMNSTSMRVTIPYKFKGLRKKLEMGDAIFSRTPKWVKNFPIEMDRMALTQLAKSSSGSFDKPREMNFVLYGFEDKESIDNAISKIQAEGWHCTAIDQADEPGKYVIECQKHEYRLTEEDYSRDSVFFMKIAELYSVGYDGWYASN